jgi:alkaline phosphatase D
MTKMDRRKLLAQAAGTASLLALAGCAVTHDADMAESQSSPARLNTDARISKIAFGSCINQTKPQPIWDAILADQPDLFIFGGDNVYASTQPWQLEALQQAYELQAQQPGFRKLRQTVPHVAIWDDHDYGLNDGGADFANKQASKQAFMDFWQLSANNPRRSHDGLYNALTLGPLGQRVQVILLDGRWFRSKQRPTDQPNAPGKERYLPDPDPTKTMLGAEQWQWLQAQLSVPADLRLIVSGVQVIAQGHGWEGWGNFPHEQARLLALIQHTQAKAVVFLSGDRHIGAIYRHQAEGHYPLYELTSSGMTHAWAQAKEFGPNRLGDLVTENHYATVEVDWTARQVELLIKSVQGQVLRRQPIALADLQ